MRYHGVFEPGDLSGLDFQIWLAQIDDAASDDVFVDYLRPKHATVLWEQSKTLIVTFEHHSDLSAYTSGVPIGWQLAQEKGMVASVGCQRTSGLVPRSPCHPPF